MKKRLSLFVSLALLTGSQISCNETLFKSVGNSLASPISVAVDTTKLRATVVNSNNREEFTGTTLSILDITNPAAPILLGSPKNPIAISNFSGQVYLDPATSLAYLPNRLSPNDDVKIDSLLRVNLNEASASFSTVDSFAAGENPFGISCCDGSGRIYVVNTAGTLNVYNPSDLSSSTLVSLQVTLSTGERFSGVASTEIVLLGSQAFITNEVGRIYVINTTEVGDTSKNPIDTIILNGGFFKGIATDGTSLFVVDGTSGSEVLRILNPASLTPVSPDTATVSEVDIGTLQKTTVALGTDPNEIVVFKGKAYVTNRGSNSVSVVDLTTNTATATIGVGSEPFGLAAFTVGATDYLYVTNLASDSISIIDLGSNAVVSTFTP